MRTDLTDITLVVDRSGSMEQIREDAEGGVNSFISQQAKEPGEALLTLVQFDTEYEFLHTGVPIQNVPRYELVPRGMTALLDAVGRAINETGERLAKMPQPDRPGLVIFVVMTDGQENSSKEFNKSQVKEMIERQQSIHAAGVADYAAEKVAAAYRGTSGKVARMRAQRSAGETVNNEFTDEEREEMK